MLCTYRKTKLHSSLFKRSLCAKNNENNWKNTFPFYQLLRFLVDDFVTQQVQHLSELVHKT